MPSILRNNFTWSVSATVVKNCFVLITYIYLARILHPSSLGLITITMVGFGAAQSFVDSGFTNALIRQPKIDINTFSSLYWFCVIIGILSAALLSISSFIVASISHDSNYIRLFLTAAMVIVFGAFGQFFISLLHRQLAFKKIAFIEITSSIVAFTITILRSLSKAGPEAYFEGASAGMLCSSLLAITFAHKIFIPQFRFRLSDIQSITKFGYYNTAERLVAFISFNLEKPIIATFFNLETLGYYSIINQLITRPLMFFSAAFSRVAFPMFVKLQDDHSALNNFYIRSLGKLAMLTFPIYGFIFIFSYPIISNLFSERYLPAVEYVLPLCILGAIWSIGNPFSSYLMAINKAKTGFYLNAISTVLTFTIYIIGGRFELKTMLWLWVGAQLIFLIPLECVLWFRYTKLSTLQYMKEITPPAIIVVILSFLINLVFPFSFIKSTYGNMAVQLFVFLLVYSIFSLFMNKTFSVKTGAT
jgi:lipopolysaccharide exporter